LTEFQKQLFMSGREDFEEVQSVQGDEIIPDTELGLGPRFNLDSCAGCHTQPDIGGTSPFVNPQVEVAKKEGADNDVPSFIKKDGPVREARFKFNPDGTPDGGVHALFTIAGRRDASGCSLHQPDFRAAVARQNVVFRIPTPLFGAGLIEAIDDDTILANLQAHSATKQSLGIRGRANKPRLSRHQSERRDDHPLWLEGPEQIARNILRRSLQRRARSNERALPAGAG
jgi:hypothetical protein